MHISPFKTKRDKNCTPWTAKNLWSTCSCWLTVKSEAFGWWSTVWYSDVLYVLKWTRDCLSHCSAIFCWSIKSENIAALDKNSSIHTLFIVSWNWGVFSLKKKKEKKYAWCLNPSTIPDILHCTVEWSVSGTGKVTRVGFPTVAEVFWNILDQNCSSWH